MATRSLILIKGGGIYPHFKPTSAILVNYDATDDLVLSLIIDGIDFDHKKVIKRSNAYESLPFNEVEKRILNSKIKATTTLVYKSMNVFFQDIDASDDVGSYFIVDLDAKNVNCYEGYDPYEDIIKNGPIDIIKESIEAHFGIDDLNEIEEDITDEEIKEDDPDWFEYLETLRSQIEKIKSLGYTVNKKKYKISEESFSIF